MKKDTQLEQIARITGKPIAYDEEKFDDFMKQCVIMDLRWSTRFDLLFLAFQAYAITHNTQLRTRKSEFTSLVSKYLGARVDGELEGIRIAWGSIE